ncbi:MAG: hypothetical protein AAGF93_08890 [Cyanobacteria bacterium P01_H01_bin.105]
MTINLLKKSLQIDFLQKGAKCSLEIHETTRLDWETTPNKQIKVYQDLLVNLASDLLASAIIAILGFLIYMFFYWRNRKEQLEFFGLTTKNPNIELYLSRLQVKPQGTEGLIHIDRGFIGPAIIKIENDAALRVRQELEAKVLALFPQKVQDWLGRQSINLKALKIPIKIGPPKSDEGNVHEYLNTNLILLGSKMYNLLSKYYLEEYLPKHSSCYCYYEKNEEGERIIGIRYKEGNIDDTPMKGRSYGREIGFIHRFRDIESNITVFLCIGHGSSATSGSVRFLMKRWKELHKEYGSRDFIICLAFEGQIANEEPIVKPKVVWKKKVD